MNPTQILPFELWREIALSDPKVWYPLVRVVRGLNDPRDREIAKGLSVSTYVMRGVTYTEYRLNGELHRDRRDGPAVVGSDGTFQYYHMGRLHRPEEEGPAEGNGGGYSAYYWMGKLHREDGPAVQFGRGPVELSGRLGFGRSKYGYKNEYYVHGVRVNLR